MAHLRLVILGEGCLPVLTNQPEGKQQCWRCMEWKSEGCFEHAFSQCDVCENRHQAEHQKRFKLKRGKVECPKCSKLWTKELFVNGFCRTCSQGIALAGRNKEKALKREERERIKAERANALAEKRARAERVLPRHQAGDMVCPECESDSVYSKGMTANGKKGYYCHQCKRSFISLADRERPYGGHDKKVPQFPNRVRFAGYAAVSA